MRREMSMFEKELALENGNDDEPKIRSLMDRIEQLKMENEALMVNR